MNFHDLSRPDTTIMVDVDEERLKKWDRLKNMVKNRSPSDTAPSTSIEMWRVVGVKKTMNKDLDAKQPRITYIVDPSKQLNDKTAPVFKWMSVLPSTLAPVATSTY